MKKQILRLALVLLCAILCCAFDLVPNESIVSTLFTVSSVFVSMGLSVIIGFDLSGVKNDDWFKRINKNIKIIQSTFLWYYAFIIVVYLIYAQMELKLSCLPLGQKFAGSFCFSTILIGILYFVVNFMELQKLKDSIAQRLHKVEEVATP